MTYFGHLDEFGHVGTYVARIDPKFRDSPVFGLAGFVQSAQDVREFGTWFHQRNCDLPAFEIERSGEHPALREKRVASLCTVTNVRRYPGPRRFTNRLLNRIEVLGGFVLHVGIR